MATNAITTQKRIGFLDGLRGVAILWVILYHSYALWTDILPFGNSFSSFPVFAFGWLGVYLFFIISGFAIIMTLERCRNFGEFILRRWLRLFPAMLVCSLIILWTAPIFPERPFGLVGYRDLLPGLTFIEPDFWEKMTGTHQGIMEGSFWSLYVEVKFYVIFGMLYFLLGWRKAVTALVVIFLLTYVTRLLGRISPEIDFHLANSMFQLIGAKFYGWFAAGALYYKYYIDRRALLLVPAVVTAAVAAAGMGSLSDWDTKLASFIVVMVFTLAVTSTWMKRILTYKILLFLGFISFPLYLLHENMTVAMIIKIGYHMPWLSGILIPVVPILTVVGLGYLVAAYIEMRVRELIRFLIGNSLKK